MAQPYLSLFDPLTLDLTETVARIEPVLATADLTFDGVVRKFERGADGSLYYCADEAKADNWPRGVQEMTSRRWPGIAFECRLRGYDVTVGLLTEHRTTTLVLDHDSVLFYELQNDVDVYQSWLAGILATTEAVGAAMSIFRKGGLKEAVSADGVLAAIRAGSMQKQRTPILVIARADLLGQQEAASLGIERVKVVSTTSGYTVMSSLHWNA